MANMFRHILKNFLNKPATRLYPANVREPFERTRGRIIFDNKNCIYCGLCSRRCPADAIKVDRKNAIWELNAFRCIICGECVNACPKKCIRMTNERRNAAKFKKVITVKKENEI